MFDTMCRKSKEELRRSACGLPSVKPDILTDKFISIPEVNRANIIMLYVGTRDESDTLPLIQRLLNQGKRVVLPRCLPGHQMEVREISSCADLVQGMFKIPEPGQHCPVVSKADVDLVLVPHVLCDRRGYRLGHGGGYYDRWLTDFCGKTVIVCSPERLVEELPHESHDLPVDIVIVA